MFLLEASLNIVCIIDIMLVRMDGVRENERKQKKIRKACIYYTKSNYAAIKIKLYHKNVDKTGDPMLLYCS